MPKETAWKRSIAWLPVYIENGRVAEFGWRWLTPVWWRWFEGRYRDYWSPCTHNWDEDD
jgi:hypothetical protein